MVIESHWIQSAMVLGMREVGHLRHAVCICSYIRSWSLESGWHGTIILGWCPAAGSWQWHAVSQQIICARAVERRAARRASVLHTSARIWLWPRHTCTPTSHRALMSDKHLQILIHDLARLPCAKCTWVDSLPCRVLILIVVAGWGILTGYWRVSPNLGQSLLYRPLNTACETVLLDYKQTDKCRVDKLVINSQSCSCSAGPRQLANK